jgi:hypothetical protein
MPTMPACGGERSGVREGQFAEAGGEQQLLAEDHGRAILLPEDGELWPNPVHLAWLRKKRFKAV